MAAVKYDLWSDGYDIACNLLEERDEYPVAGYKEVLNQVYQRVRTSSGKKVLELGFGTGILARKLYQDGYEIHGVDHSESVVDVAREDMPKVHFLCDDYEMGIPEEMMFEEFDVCIATYSINKMDAYEKADLFQDVLDHLRPGGKLIVGDVAFENLADMKKLAREFKDRRIHFDYPLVHEEAIKDFPELSWTPVSKCAAILELDK